MSETALCWHTPGPASPPGCRMQGIIRAATAKMAREVAFQPRLVRVVWPYGGSGNVVLSLDPSVPGKCEPPAAAEAAAAGHRPRAVPSAYSPRREAPGPVDARAAAQDTIVRPGSAGGPLEIPMTRVEQGAHTAEVWVRTARPALLMLALQGLTCRAITVSMYTFDYACHVSKQRLGHKQRLLLVVCKWWSR